MRYSGARTAAWYSLSFLAGSPKSSVDREDGDPGRRPKGVAGPTVFGKLLKETNRSCQKEARAPRARSPLQVDTKERANRPTPGR